MVRANIRGSLTISLTITFLAFVLILYQSSAFSLIQSSPVAQHKPSSTSLDSSNSSLPPTIGKTIILKGGSTFQTIITNDTLQLQHVTSIEGSFRILHANKTDSHAGIIWSEGNKDYYAYIRPASGTLSMYTSEQGELMHIKINPPLAKDPLYSLRIVLGSKTTDVLLNNTSGIHISQVSSNRDISKVGIRTYKCCRI